MKDRNDPNWPPDPIDVEVDSSPPTVTIAVPGAVAVGVPFTVSGTAHDDISVETVGISIDGGARIQAQADGAGWSRWSARATFAAAGSRTISAVVTDRSGKNGGASISVQVLDPTGPLLSVMAPTPGPDGRIVVGTRAANLEFTAIDPESPVVAARAFVAGNQVGVNRIDAARWSVTIPMPNVVVPAGGSNVTCELQATNRDGATSTASVVLHALDVTAPRVEFAPPDGAQAPGTLDGADLEVMITASDVDPLRLESGIANVRVQVDGGSLVDATTTGSPDQWTAVVHVPAADSHLVTVTCGDGQGNVTTVTHTVTVALATDFHDLRRATYLSDLLQFAENSLLTSTDGHAVSTDLLSEVLRQPLSDLVTSPSAAEPVPALRIVTTALQRLLDAEVPVPYAQWRLDEGTGERAAVHGLREATGQIVGGTWGPGRDGGAALYFDGSTSYVEIGDTSRLEMREAVTIAAWIRPTGPGVSPEGGIIVNKEGSYEVARFPDGTIRWAIATTVTNTWAWIDTEVVVPLDEWHHVAVSYDGDRVRTYLNGVERSVIELGASISDVDPALNSLRIGGRELPGFLQAFQGAISDVRLYNRALSAYEVAGMVGPVRAEEEVWLDDGLPTGASADILGVDWVWTTDQPQPSTGQQCHRSDPTQSGQPHVLTMDPGQPGFRVHPGDLLFTDVWLDPAAPPTWFGIGWLDENETWHDSGWTDADLPVQEPGLWTRLIVPARQLQLEGHVVRGLSFTMLNGGGAWDRTGRRSWRTRSEFDPLPANAYRTLLREIGTSYDELRLVRTAEPAARTALADRLGISLRPQRPGDELDQLLLSLDQVTDADLQRLFGYTGAGSPTLTATPSEPLLVTWRHAWLRENWRRQDDRERTQNAYRLPVIDPDLVYWQDLDPTAGLVWRLRDERAAWVRTQLGILQSVREGFVVASEGFAAVVDSVLSGMDLDQLDLDWRAGQTIDTRLTGANLTLGAFVRLRQIDALAAAGSVLDEEWDELYSILVQVLKTRIRPQWSAEEAAAGVRLEPGQFVTPALQAVLELPQWRAYWTDRLAWQDRLRARTGQLSGVDRGLAAAVRNAEEQCLPALRDALVQTIAGGSDPGEVTTGLTQLLHLEVAASGAVLVSPIDQAVQSIQSLLFAARTRTLDSWLRGDLRSPAENWVLASRPGHEDPEFDAEWQWMGSYPTWRAAMSVFMSPENLLLPTLHADLSEPFQAFVAFLDNATPLTPHRVQVEADAYADVVKPTVQWPNAVDQADRDLIFRLGPPAETDLGNRRAAQQRVLDGFGISAWSNAPQWMRETLLFVPLQAAAALRRTGQFLAALDWFRAVYAADADPNLREVFAGFARDVGTVPDTAGRPIQWLLNSLNPHDIAAARGGTYRRHVLLTIAACLLDFADAEFTLDTPESQPRARTMYLLAQELLGDSQLDPPPASVRPGNPVLDLLRLRCEVNLGKLRQGLNIAGMPRASDSIPAEEGQDVVAAGPSGLTAPRPSLQPSPYRFTTLVTRAQQLLASAGQVEAAYLASLEKRDLERYSLFKARQDLELVRARVDLQSALVEVASAEEELIDLQRQRAALQWETYNRWITAGPNGAERAQRRAYEESGQLRSVIAEIDTVTSIAQTAIQVAGSQLFSAPVAMAAGVAFGIAALIRNNQQAQLIAAETTAQIAALESGWQRRNNDWVLARDTADKDVAIARQQRAIATQRTDIARGEAGVAALQQGHADATVQFLATKFTNADLYAWMSGVLGGVYSYLLQQATVVARLAEQQLAFERQDVQPPTIKSDYWSSATDQPAAGIETSPDRGGLTGSARLLRDLTSLEQYAFDTNKRKLQLSHSFSLAMIAPMELQDFRQSGELPFSTPMEMFDRGYPGHYLRTIRKIRVTVVGLIPPVHGIRASLTSSGVSRVVVGRGGGFSTVTIRRTPETVALTSPMGASGVFELDLQPELLLPFEGTGVDTTWRFLMPRPANPFDLRNIADIVVTMDYTALHDPTYAEQVRRSLPRTDTGVRAFSLRDDFPDSWFELIDAAEQNRRLEARINAVRADFPPHLEGLSTEALSLYVIGKRASAPGQLPAVEVGVETLTRDAGTAEATVFGAARTADGVISTLTGTGTTWQPAVGADQSPLGEWELAVTNNPLTRKALTDGVIDDLVFAITYRGSLPPWPS